MPAAEPPGEPPARQPLAVAAFAGGILLTYGALLAFIVRVFLSVAQARNAILLATMGFIIAVHNGLAHQRVACRISRHGTVLFAVSLLVAALWNHFQLWPLSILALALALAALVSFVFGREGARAFFPFLTAFVVLSMATVALPRIDRILRLLSAWYATSWLDLVGIPALMIVRTRTPLILFSAGDHIFEVASECSGFGIILVSVVLTVILSFGRRYSWLVRIGLVYLALLIGFAFNILRISVIAVLAIRTDWSYVLIHEGVGTLLFFMALAVTFGLTELPRERETYAEIARMLKRRGTVVDFRTVAPSRKLKPDE